MPVNRFEPPSADKSLNQVADVIDVLAKLGSYAASILPLVQVGSGAFARLAPRAAGQQVVIPTATPDTFGQVITLFVESSLGDLRVRPVSGTINGVASVTYPATLATYTLKIASNGNGRWATSTSSVGAGGATGPTGPTGPTGATGATGSAGPPGFDGADGADGSDGPPGPAGAAGSAGPPGAAGATGVGIPGSDGQDGSDGPPGPAGPPGADGATGPQGPQGFPGPQGDPGADGSDGPPGASGAPGAPGAAGPQGSPGSDGPEGPEGPQGEQGPEGPMLAAIYDSGALVQNNIQAIDFINGTNTTAIVTAGASGRPTVRIDASGGGGGSTFLGLTAIEVDLGSVPRWSGTFTIAGTGMTIGTNVLITQANGPYTGKGTLADEAEEQVSVSAQVTSTTVITAYWEGVNGPILGNVIFLYAVASATSNVGWDDVNAVDRTSGAFNPNIIAGQYLQLGPDAGLPALGDIRKTGVLDIASSDGVRLFAENNILIEGGNDVGDELELQCQSVIIDTQSSSGGRFFLVDGHVVMDGGSTAPPVTIAGNEGMFWVNNGGGDQCTMPWFNGDDGTEQELIKSRRFHSFYDEFDYVGVVTTVSLTAANLNTGQGNWAIQAFGNAGSISMLTGIASHEGILNLTTSNVAIGDSVAIFKGLGSNSTWVIGSELYRFEFIIQMVSTTTQGFRIGLSQDTVGNQAGNTDLIRFEYDTNTDANIHCVTREASASTDTDTGVAPGTGWNILTAFQSVAGTVEFYIDSVLEATHSTNVPDTEPMNYGAMVFSRAAATRTMRLDYTEFRSQSMNTRSA